MASNDIAAFGCVNALKGKGISVPEEISVTGADGLKLPGILLELDSFCYPSFEIGRTGAELLIRQIRKKGEIQNITLPTIPADGKTLCRCAQ